MHGVTTSFAATGISGLDDVLGGEGLARGRLFLIEGRPGTGKTTVAMQFSPASAIPSESEISTTLPPRACTSCMFDTVFSNNGPDGASTMIGTESSISAIGPCFISPAA